MNFNEFKNIKYKLDKATIDKPMLPWVKKFNALSNVFTTFSCDGYVDKKQMKQILKTVPKEFKGKIESLAVHPYIAMHINSPTIILFNEIIKDLNWIPFFEGVEVNEFAYGIRTWQGIFTEYFFWFPINENFEEKIKKIYDHCKFLAYDKEKFGGS